MTYLITYNIATKNGRSKQDVNDALEDAIVGFGSWMRYIPNVWVVDTDMTADQMTAALRERLDDKDDLLIVGARPPYQGWLPKDAWSWLNEKTQADKDEMEDKRLAAAR